MKLKKYIPHVLVISLSIAIATILWLTLFSRLDTDVRHFYPPFWSYKAILSGSEKALFEDIGNIILFIPFGVLAALYLRQDLIRSLLIGVTISLIIESCQWFFWLGAFEIDDLLHNTMGTVFGAFLVQRTVAGERIQRQIKNRKKGLAIRIGLVSLLILLPLGYQGCKNRDMKRLAALNDKEDSKNLLVLSADPKNLSHTDLSVIYNSDGSILIEGESEKRAWIQIAKFSLKPGQYYMEGLSGLKKRTVGLELAAYDYDQDKYVMVGHEVAVIDRLDFELKEQTKMEVLISLYPGWEGSVTARPAIFRED